MFIGRTDVEAETPIFWPPDEDFKRITVAPLPRRLSGSKDRHREASEAAVGKISPGGLRALT